MHNFQWVLGAMYYYQTEAADTWFSSTENYYSVHICHIFFNPHSILDQYSFSKSTFERWEHGVLLLGNKVFQKMLFICYFSQVLSTVKACWLPSCHRGWMPDFHHIQSATKLLFLLMKYFLPSSLIAFALSWTCPPWAIVIASSWVAWMASLMSHEPSHIFIAGWIFLKHNSDGIISLSKIVNHSSVTRDLSPGSQVKVLCG